MVTDILIFNILESRRENSNIKMDLREIGCDDVNCIKLAQDKLLMCFCNDW